MSTLVSGLRARLLPDALAWARFVPARLHRARGGTTHIDWDGLRSRGQVQTR